MAHRLAQPFMATNPPKKSKTPEISELLDTDVLFPSMQAPDRLAVLMSSEHVLQVLDALWFDSLQHRKVAEPNKDGGMAWKMAEEQTVRASGARANPALMIRLCYLLGLIDEKNYVALERVRFIRNRMAHSRLPVTLDDPGISMVLEELGKSLRCPTTGTAKMVLKPAAGHSYPPGFGPANPTVEMSPRKLAFVDPVLPPSRELLP